MYAPVSTLAIREADDHLIGYAAPVEGPAPCILRLMADDIPIAAARATRFSSVAQAKSIRLGWCGVRVPGLATATAVGTDLKVRCGVTNRILWQRKAQAPVARPRMQDRRPLTVFEIIALSRAEDESPSLAEIRPIMQRHLQERGAASFVNATYETFLGRSAEKGASDGFPDGMNGESIKDWVNGILDSLEYKRNPLKMIPGPFNSAFRYDLNALDAV